MYSQLLPTVAALPGNEDESGAGGLLAAEKREDFSQKINLDLEIGSCACASEEGLKRNKKIKQEEKESFFTAAQFHEFYNQILVYNSISSGLPVAFHLLLRIWMSVFNSLGPAIYKKYPSFIGFSPQSSDHSSVMDSEPGRCRRTDGRKWRCSKNVVPYQKYCERHMHRGRQGSRKHVEPIESVSRLDNKTSDDNRMPMMSLVTSDIDSRIAISIQSDLDPSQPCSNYRSRVPANLKCRSDEIRDALFAIQTTVDACPVGNEINNNINVDCAKSTCSNSKTNCSTNEGNHAEGKSSFDEANPKKIGGRRQSIARDNYVGFVSPRFGLSPKSVLHCAAGNVGLGPGSKTVIEAEPQRCRRTDGKKWQCRRDALPNQKYCEAHMHRGAKRLMGNPESVSNSRATSARRAHTSSTITRNLDNGINLNTVPASPQHITGNNSTSSTSDATTITDENISFCLAQSLHNC